MFDKCRVPLGIIAIFFSGTIALGETATNNLNVSLSVVQTCSVATESLIFPSNSFGASINTPTATVTVTCNGGATAPTITIGVGANAVGAVVPRRMRFAGPPETFIPYTLTSVATAIVTDTALTLIDNTDATYSATIFASATVPASVPKGIYSDTVVMTVTYTP
jgi:spore coat protein U-like protein